MSELPCGHPAECELIDATSAGIKKRGVIHYCGWCEAIAARDEAIAELRHALVRLDRIYRDENEDADVRPPWLLGALRGDGEP